MPVTLNLSFKQDNFKSYIILCYHCRRHALSIDEFRLFSSRLLTFNFQVAIKIISSKNIKSDREKDQIRREREVLLRLKHPNIVNLLKVRHSLTLEFLHLEII